MNKHTPRPWSVSLWVDIQAGYTKQGEPIVVANVGQADNFRGEHVVTSDKEELLANAHLIAASPDLLETLEDLICAAISMPVSYDNLCQGTLDSAVISAEEAVAKARGNDEEHE